MYDGVSHFLTIDPGSPLASPRGIGRTKVTYDISCPDLPGEKNMHSQACLTRVARGMQECCACSEGKRLAGERNVKIPEKQTVGYNRGRPPISPEVRERQAREREVAQEERAKRAAERRAGLTDAQNRRRLAKIEQNKRYKQKKKREREEKAHAG